MHRKDENKENNTGEDLLFDFFREKLENVELPVSERCRDNVFRQIAEGADTRKKKFLRLVSATAAILLVALLSGIFYYVSDITPNPLVVEHTVAQREQPSTQNKDTAEPKNNLPSATNIAQTAHPVAENSANKTVIRANAAPTQPALTDPIPATVETIETENVVNNQPKQTLTADTQSHVAEKADKVNLQDSIDISRQKELQNLLDLYNNVQQDDVLIAELPKNQDNNKWGISASFGSATSSSRSVQSPALLMQNSPSATLDDVYYAEKNTTSAADIDYAPPFSVGLTISKGLNKTFAIETGLVYSYLSTKYKDLDNKSYSTNVKLHYLGVPVNLQANIWNIDSQFKVYASGGVMLEKGIKYNFSQDNQEMQQTVNDKNNISGVQWSLNGSIGASYKFYDNWNVYVEPQVSHYFDNDQPISIRTEKNTIFSLNSGIRYEF